MDYCCISVEQVYGESNPKIPEGYKQIDFRPYKKGDTILTESISSKGNGVALVVEHSTSSYCRPYIILEKLPPKPKPEVIESSVSHAYEVTKTEFKTVGEVYNKDVTIPTGFKFKTFRPPAWGDWYIATWCEAVYANATPIHGDDQPRIILEKL